MLIGRLAVWRAGWLHVTGPETRPVRPCRHRHHHARGGAVTAEGLGVMDGEASVLLPAHHRPHHSECLRARPRPPTARVGSSPCVGWMLSRVTCDDNCLSVRGLWYPGSPWANWARSSPRLTPCDTALWVCTTPKSRGLQLGWVSGQRHVPARLDATLQGHLLLACAGGLALTSNKMFSFLFHF